MVCWDLLSTHWSQFSISVNSPRASTCWIQDIYLSRVGDVKTRRLEPWPAILALIVFLDPHAKYHLQTRWTLTQQYCIIKLGQTPWFIMFAKRLETSLKYWFPNSAAPYEFLKKLISTPRDSDLMGLGYCMGIRILKSKWVIFCATWCENKWSTAYPVVIRWKLEKSLINRIVSRLFVLYIAAMLLRNFTKTCFHVTLKTHNQKGSYNYAHFTD